jgi:hypothetical protein
MGYGFEDARHCLDTTDLSDVIEKVGISQRMHMLAGGHSDASSHETAIASRLRSEGGVQSGQTGDERAAARTRLLH